jgi:hypothetical protein
VQVVTERDESSEERLFPKTRLLSDILSSSAASNANTNASPKPTSIHLFFLNFTKLQIL